jgi:hypothetical protein
MKRRAAVSLSASMLMAALFGAYLAAANCPDGWWNSADLASGSARIGYGVIVGVVVALIARYCVAWALVAAGKGARDSG